MKLSVKTSALVCVFLLPLTTLIGQDKEDGWHNVKGKAPEFTLTTFDRTQIESSSLKGKVILLEFWDTHCGPCLELMPEMEKLYEKFKDNPNVAIYIINAGWEKIEKAKEFMAKKKYKFISTYVTKEQSRKQLGVSTLPATLIIDKKFDLRFKHLGFDEETEMDIVNTFEKHIQELLK